MTSEKNSESGSTLSWTGERYIQELDGNIALEHLHRYTIARELATDKHVLDIASGEGYGSAILAEVAHRVIGVDISKDAIGHANLKYKKDNLEFKVGSCSNIPINNASVDLVVSFETIEHHGEHDAMMSEIKRVLRPNGVLIISSPDKHEYSEIPRYNNPFHVKELYRQEFEKLMTSHFKYVTMYGQRVTYGSMILQEEKIGDVASFNRENSRIKVTKGLARPVYLIAVASDGTVPRVTSGVFEQPINESEIVRSWEGLVRERDKHLAALKSEVASLKQALIKRDEQIATLITSVSWRLTRPLRFGGRLVRGEFGMVLAPFRRADRRVATEARRVLRVLRREGVRGVMRRAYVFMRGGQGSAAAIDAEVSTIRNSGLFDESYYRSMYVDLEPAPPDVIRHYCEYGWREGKNPSDDFDTQFYLATYSDIRNAGINPFFHYVVVGASEGRQVLPESATRHENDIRFGDVDTDVKLIAFYACPDWATVRSGRPLFKGHKQPLLPHEELGLYDSQDLRLLRRQAQTAKRHGIYGFCFQLSIGADGCGSSLPVESFLDHDDIDLRFCLRVELSSEDVPESLVAALVRAVSDRRYICIADRPVVLVAMPNETRLWANLLTHLRGRLAEQGVGSPFLIGQWEPASEDNWGASPTNLCDAALDLPGVSVPGERGDFLPLDTQGIDVVPYRIVASHGIVRARKAQGSAYPLYHAVSLGRDNTACSQERPVVYTRFNLKDYRRWLDAAIAGARVAHSEDRRFVFVNAWNSWNDGLFLEPDREGGFSRLNETTRALLRITSGTATPKVSVIVPNYNHEPFLSRRLDSIYGQTYKNIEVILLDDCSSDQSRSMMDRYAGANADITRRVYNDENSGSAFRQWAKGIKEARGDLVWIAESDDYCDERFLETLVRCFDDEAVLLAYSKCVFVDRDEIPIRYQFQTYVNDLECADKWKGSYVETAHNEVRTALGIKNTIPNASGVLFRRPIHMPLLEDESWLSMSVAGDWVFYLHIIRGGKIAYNSGATSFFRRYEGSTAEVTYEKRAFYREVGMASRTVASLYDVPLKTLEQCRKGYRAFYEKMVGQGDEEFALLYDYESILQAREKRLPNVMVSTMGFSAGGAEILPIRLANEFKRQGLSVLLLNAGLMPHEDRIHRMLRNDVPVVETSDVEDVKTIIHEFGVEVLSTHQWHIQRYPLRCPDVFDELQTHIASLHGMIENADAFGATSEQLREVDRHVGAWVYTAEKNLKPFSDTGLFDEPSSRFVKIPNGMQPPEVVPVPRADMSIPEDAFVLCCVSRAIPEKGWEETISAVERARALSGRDIRLILVGNGPVYDKYCSVGAPDFVHFAGFNENSVGHYAAADMGIMLTKFKSESFPLTIVDCLFAGKPYIASDVGDIRNMLTTADGLAGEVIGLENWEIPIERAAEVVVAFAADSGKYQKAAALARDAAHRYRIDVVASEYVRLFKASPTTREKVTH
jgi:glycosyltransferase involved in cell wall biosynthesis/ubiquinone/menaquinone biosynthesis C-methylase UbiE